MRAKNPCGAGGWFGLAALVLPDSTAALSAAVALLSAPATSAGSSSAVAMLILLNDEPGTAGLPPPPPSLLSRDATLAEAGYEGGGMWGADLWWWDLIEWPPGADETSPSYVDAPLSIPLSTPGS